MLTNRRLKIILMTNSHAVQLPQTIVGDRRVRADAHSQNTINHASQKHAGWMPQHSNPLHDCRRTSDRYARDSHRCDKAVKPKLRAIHVKLYWNYQKCQSHTFKDMIKTVRNLPVFADMLDLLSRVIFEPTLPKNISSYIFWAGPRKLPFYEVNNWT